MMRPFTCCCLLLAAGAGLYTYQAKHQAELVDREIARVLKLADAARARTGVLRAEYALLNDPSRLTELATTHLPELRNTEPQQFTSLAELDRRLPAVGQPAVAAPPISEPPDVGPPVAMAAPANPTAAVVAAAAARPPLGAQVTQASWPLIAPAAALAATPAGSAAGRAVVASQNLPPPSAARAKPLVQKVAAAVRRPAKPDAFMTAAAAPADALTRLAANPSLQTTLVDSPTSHGTGVGRSGMGGGTSSLLGMARASGATPYPASAPPQ